VECLDGLRFIDYVIGQGCSRSEALPDKSTGLKIWWSVWQPIHFFLAMQEVGISDFALENKAIVLKEYHLNSLVSRWQRGDLGRHIDRSRRGRSEEAEQIAREWCL